MRFPFIVLFLFFYECVSAQLNGKYNFRNIDPSDGLLYSAVKGIGQDKQGFIWIVTINGLQRYDGSRFVNYPGITDNSPYGSLSDCQLYVDTFHNYVYVIKWQQLDRLNLDNNSFTSLTIKNFLEGDTTIQPVTFTDDHQNKWTVSTHGLIYNEKENPNVAICYFDIYTGDKHYGKNIVRDTSSGVYWIGGYNHFLIGDLGSRKMIGSTGPRPDNNLLNEFWSRYGNDSRIRLIMKDSYHNLWIATWRHYLHRYNLDTKKFYTYSLKDIKNKENGAEKGDLTLLINSAYEDRQRNLWFATDYAGLLLYNREKDDFDFLTSDEKIRNGLRYNYSISTIFQDREDNIWLGTDRGISIFNPYRNYFQAIRHLDGNDASIPKNDINDVIQTSQGEILIATWGGGISIYDSEWNFLRNVEFSGVPELNLVWSFAQNDDGTIWAGTQQGYIHQYDPVKHVFTTFQPSETEHSTIINMLRDHHGNILLGLNNGRITFWEKEKRKFYAMDTASKYSYPTYQIVNIYEDRNNHYWITTSIGLREYDAYSHSYVGFFQPDSIDSSIGVLMNGVEEFNDSTLMIGTVYRGIYLFNLRTKKFSRVASGYQLNHASVSAIKKDPEGNIWVTTNYNLYKIGPELKDPVIYNIDHVMMNAAFSSHHFLELADGKWVTYTPAEIICFDPEKMRKEYRELPAIEISRFSVFDHSIYIDSFLARDKPILLPYNQNFISIEFSSGRYMDWQQTNYYYRLSSVDKNWIYSTTKNFADYTDLKPGDYIFEVKADDGNASTPVTSFRIVIAPPWWGTIWFRISAVLAIGAFIYFILRKRIQLIRNESELKHRVAETEMMALRSQMNPHFIFNCINGIDAMIQSNDKYRATMFLNKFAKLIRNVLDTSKENKVPISKDMETLQLYLDLELFRHHDKFTASIHTDEELLQGDYRVPPLIIQPYVENAILHGLRNRNGNGGKLTITVTKHDDRITYVIEDNGVGRKITKGEKNGLEEGFGMQMSQDRIRLFNEEEIASVTITDLQTDGHPAGTRVNVNLKIQ